MVNIRSSVLWLCWVSVGVRVTEAQSNDGINGGVLGDGGARFTDGGNQGESNTDNASGGEFDGGEHNGGGLKGENDSRGQITTTMEDEGLGTGTKTSVMG